MDQSHEALLKNVLDRIAANNQQLKPGTPLAELKDAIEAALAALPPLQFEEFSRALEGVGDVTDRLIRRAPEIIGWDADKITDWIQDISQEL